MGAPRATGRKATILLAGAPLLLASLLSGGLAEAQHPEALGHVSTVIGPVGPAPDAAPSAQSRDPAAGWTQVEWRYAGKTWSLNVSVDPELLLHYEQMDRLPYDHDYAAFVLDQTDDPWVTNLAHALDELYTDAGIQGTAKADGFLAFVQSFPYALDKETTPYSEWPRYPAETLTADASDCEDTVILLVSLLRVIGYDTVLINPPRHMAAGIALDEEIDGTYVEHDGQRYYYAETTGERWRIGKLPSRFDDATLRVIPLDPQALLARPTWTVEAGGDGQLQVKIAAQNVGDLPARDVVLSVELEDRHRKVWQRGTCPAADAAPFSTLSCTVLLNAPPGDQVLRVRAYAESPDAKPRTESGPLDW